MCETSWPKGVGAKLLGPKNVFSINSGCEMSMSKKITCETSWSEKSGAKRPVAEYPDVKRQGPTRLGAKRPGPKYPCATLRVQIV